MKSFLATVLLQKHHDTVQYITPNLPEVTINIWLNVAVVLYMQHHHL